MRSKIKYSKKTVSKYHDTRYYEVRQDEIKRANLINEEKKRLKTVEKPEVSETIMKYRKLLKKNSTKMSYKLKSLHRKNQENIYEKKNIINSKLLSLVASFPMLIYAYRKIRKNTGATTLGYYLSKDQFNELDEEQKKLTRITSTLPDNITKQAFLLTIKLLRKGKYPWGVSRRIYVDKPGKNTKRPITIPPFMDRVVQQAINLVLQAVYEPEFDKLNCSFGFRPRKSVHYAIYSLQNEAKSTGLWNALEGDIKSAYDKVNKDILIEIMKQKIKDKKFLDLIKQRLDYQYYDLEKEEYIKEDIGLPQGGIDSPYLWNIYFNEFDKFIQNEFTNIINEINKNIKKKKPPLKQKLERIKSSLKTIIQFINNQQNESDKIIDFMEITDKKRIEKYNTTYPLHYAKEIKDNTDWLNLKTNIKLWKYNLIRYRKKISNEYLKIPSLEMNSKRLRFIYSRYADDFLLLTNFKISLLYKYKELFANVLRQKLNAELSGEKTLITDLRKTHANFLGFQIRAFSKIKIGKYEKDNEIIKARLTGSQIHMYVDSKRLLDRWVSKGYCNNKGFPNSIPSLCHLEGYMIIERYNQVIRGLVSFYTQFVRYPKRTLSRWIYILRFSCFKTLAQKYRTNIRGIFKRFKDSTHKKYFRQSKENTISIKAIMQIDNTKYYKKWTLLHTKRAINLGYKNNIKGQVLKIYWALQRGEKLDYVTKDSKNFSIIDDNFEKAFNFTNLRTQASFDLPCSICGNTKSIQMHHIRHVRKKKYILRKNVWDKSLGIKNRKQIPVCKECHIRLIHKGIYDGESLKKFSPKIMYDNRIINIEGYLTKTNKSSNKYAKTLHQKGWRIYKGDKQQ